MAEYLKPLPEMDEVSRPFWKGCQRRELLLQRCAQCERYQFYPRPLCLHCYSDHLDWVRSPGIGRVYSFTVTYQNLMPGFAEEVPYIFALVDLDEGVRMTTNIVGCKPEDVRVGMPVQVVFEYVSREITLPKFRPAS